MKTFLDFIQCIIEDLKLGAIAPNVQKALELNIGTIVDEQIENALAHSLTEEDWKVYDAYRLEHPDSRVTEAMQAMVTNRPEIADVIEGALKSTYDDMMAREEAVRLVLNETKEA